MEELTIVATKIYFVAVLMTFSPDKCQAEGHLIASETKDACESRIFEHGKKNGYKKTELSCSEMTGEKLREQIEIMQMSVWNHDSKLCVVGGLKNAK